MADESEKICANLAQADDPEDENLDDLLCSALDDLENPSAPLPATTESKPDKIKAPTGLPADLEKAWNDEFAEQFKKYLQDESGAGAEAVAASLQKMTEAAAEALQQATAQTPVTPSAEDPVSAAISQTLRNLADNANNLQSPLTEDEIMNMFGSLGLTEGPNGDSDIFPFMQNMMQSLLSKDILLPALKNIVDKYPAWLDEHRAGLSNDKIEGYTKQLELMRNVCEELDRESPSDTDDVKNQRFDKVLDYMQKMQDCGLPPAELMGDLPQDLDPSAGNLASQCCLM